MAILKYSTKCIKCGEVMQAGTVVNFEKLSYSGANGEFISLSAKPRYVASHAEPCRALRVEAFMEAVKKMNYYHTLARSYLFSMQRGTIRVTVDDVKEAYRMAHAHARRAKEYKALLAS